VPLLTPPTGAPAAGDAPHPAAAVVPNNLPPLLIGRREADGADDGSYDFWGPYGDRL
jgi:hypothetical protein